MTASIILYGSQARGDARSDSDVDIILAKISGTPETPRVSEGASVHFYPQNWLMKRAVEGDLFVGHVALEGKSLFDPDYFLQRLRTTFRLRGSYKSEYDVAAAIIQLLISRNWGLETALRRRYFWAIRTVATALSASSGTPAYSSAAIENAMSMPGLASHIDRREQASFAECRDFGKKILEHESLEHHGSYDQLVAYLQNSGDIGTSTVRMFETHEAQEFGASALYA